MDVTVARALLEVGPSATAEELRAAYRARLRAVHPDVRGRDGGTAEVVAAYRLLRAAPSTGPIPAGDRGGARPPGVSPADGPARPAPSVDVGPPGAVAVVVDGDTVIADLPAGDLFALLTEAGHRLGQVAYVDGSAGILEIVVDVEGYGACSVVLTLQGRAAGGPAGGAGGCTEAWCTVEPLAGGPAPAVDVVTGLLADALQAVVG